MKKITSHSFRLLLSGLFLMLMFTSSFVYSQHLTISTSGGDVGPIGGTNWGISDNVLYVGNSGSASINISVITNHLANTGDLTINLPGQSNVGRNIYINNTIAYLGSSARTLTFQSGNDIVFANAVGITSATASLNVVLRSATTTGTPDNGSVKMDGINIDTKGGHLWVGGGATTSTWNGLNVGNSAARTYLDDVAGISLVGSTIASGGGKIYMYAQSWNTTDDDGVNYGINVENSNVSSGTGSINFAGGVYGRYNNGIGMRVIGTSATSITSTTGAITIYGYGTDATTNGNLWRTATMINGSVSIKSGSGNIAVTGEAAFASPVNDKEGLVISDGSAICSQTGNITLNGTNTLESSGQYTNSIRFAAGNLANSIRIGYDGTNAYSGNITIEGNSIYQRSTHAGAGSIAVQTTGTLTIQPTGTAFTYMRAGDAGTLTFDNDWNFGTTLGGFVYGKSTNTTALTYSNALTTNGPITMYAGALDQSGAISSSGAITFNSASFSLGNGINLSTSTASDITINTNGNFGTAGSTRSTISSANGSIIIHADKDANGSGTLDLDYLTFNPGTGATIIRGETVSFFPGSASGPYINGTGSFTFQSSDASFTPTVNTSWFEIDQDNNGISGLTLGKAGNIADILQNRTLTIAGPVNMYGNTITFSSPLTATNSDVSLYANTAVTQTSPIIAAGLSLNGTGTFTLTNTSNDFTTLAGGAVGSLLGTTQIVDVSGGLTIGTIGSNTGLKGANTIRVETLAGNLTLAGNISTTSTSTDAVILTAAKSTAIGVPTGGDILVSGSPTITMGTGAIAKLFSGYDVTSTGLTTLAGGASNVRINYDETTTTYNPVLSANNKYAIYRTALGYGDLNIVSSGGDAEGSTWTYANGVITPTSGTANVLNTVVQTKLNSANLSIEANKITFSANVTGSTSNTFNLLAKTHIVNTNATTITTQGGNVLLASNVDDATDNENTVNGYIVLGSGLTMNTNGGNITFGGGNATGTDYALGTSAYPYEGIRVDNIINLNSGGGNISMRGKSYAISTTAGAWGVGFWNLATGSINSGTGTVTLNGFSQSSGSSYSSALFSNGALTITSANTTADAIQMIGKSTGNGGEAWGLEAESALSLLATGTGGGITVSSSQQDSANNYDIVIRGEANILAKSGPINLLGGQSGGITNGTMFLASNAYLGSKASSAVPTSSSTITIQYDLYNFNNITKKLATSGTLNWKPVSASFGQNVVTSWFDWNQNSQTLSGLTIGKSGNAANVYLNNAITVAGPVNVYGATIEISGALTASESDVSLYANTAVTQSAPIIAAGLSLNGTGTFTLTNTSNNFTTLAGGAVGSLIGATQIVDVSGGLTIGTIGSNTGLTGSNTIRVETLAGNLTLAGNISTTSTSTDAVILTAAKSTAIGVGTGGDIIVSGSPTITMGSGGISKLFSGLESTSSGLTTLAGGSSNVRNNYDETTSTFSPVLSANNRYAIYRTNSGVGALTIVSSNGDAINSTWTYENGIINTKTTPVNILSSVIENYLASGPLTINAGNTTISSAITSASSNAFVLNANSTLSNTTPTTTVNAAITNAGSITINTGTFNVAQNITTTSTAAITISATNQISTSTATRRTISTQGGNITLNADNDANGSGWLDIDDLTLNPGAGNLIVRGETFNINGTESRKPYINGTGSFTFESNDASFGQDIASSWFVMDQDANGISGFNFGKSGNTVNVYLNTALTVAGPISVYGNYVEFTGNMTSSANGDIFIKSLGNGNNPSVAIGSGITINKSSGTGTLTFQANGRVTNNGTLSATGTGLLNLVMWSDYDNTNNDGGVSQFGTISTNGGHVWMGGSNSASGSYTWNGLTVGDGPSIGTFGYNCNAMDVFGPITTAGGDVLLWASTPGCGTSSITADTNRLINAGSGDITLIAPQTAGALELTSTGVISLVPHAGSYASALTLGGTLTSGNFSFNTSHYNGMKINSIANVGGLTVGKYEGMLSSGTPVVLGNTSNVSFTTNTNIGGPIIVYGGTIALDANLTTTNNGDITLYTDNAIAGLSAQRNITAAGSFNYIPRSDSFSAPVTYPITNLNLISSGLLIGKPTNTANITFANTTSIAGPITAYGGDIAVNSNLSSTLSTGTGISLNGTKITQNTNINVVTSGSHIDYVVTNAPFTAGADDGIGIGQNALVDAAGGNISLTASYASTGVAGTNNLLYDNLIRFSQDSRIVTNGSGTINIIGDGTNNTATGNAVWTISLLANNCRIQTDSGAITIDGTGGKSSTNSRGIVSDGYSARILSTSGPITLIDRKPVGYTGVTYAGLYLRPTSTTNFIIGADGTNVVNSSSPITIQSDRFYVDVTSTRRIEFKTSGSFVLEPLSSSFESFNLTGFTLTGNPSSVRIGKSTNTADITTTSAITAAGPISAYGGNIAVNGALTATNSSISLQASGTVTQSAAITATNLELSGTGTFTLTNTSNNVGTIAGGTSSSKLGSLTYIDSNALTIGAITNPGIIATGKINIQTLTNNLNLNSSVATDNTATDAVILNAGKSAAIGTSTGGDIIVSGTPTVTTGTNGIAKLFSGTNASSTGLTSLVGGSGNTRSNYDENSTSFSPVLVNGNNYALYRFRDLTCEEILAITVHPTVVTSEVCKDTASETISFTSTASDYTIQWYSNSSNSYSGATLIPAASSNSLSLPTTAVGTKYYFAKLTSNSVSCIVNTNIVSQRVLPIISNISNIYGTPRLTSETTEATFLVLPVNGATSYVWNLPSGITRVSQTGPSITVAIASSFSVDNLSVYALNSCGQTQTRSIIITKPKGGINFNITGDVIICSNTTKTYTATSVLGGTYNWTVPTGITIVSGQGTNVITVNSGANFKSGYIKSTCETSTFTYESSYAVSGSSQPSAITGPVNLCSLTNATYSVTNTSNTTYRWSVPSGMSITTGGNSSSITVSISSPPSGNISVTAITNCGESFPVYLPVNTTPILGSINGVSRVCGAAQITFDSSGNILNNNALNSYTYNVATVSGADSYNWTAPNGATIESGQGTNTITVSYDLATFETGVISVRSINNSCGSGTERNLTVSAVSGNITGPSALCSITSTSYSVSSDLGTGFVWTLPQGMNITSGIGTANITVSISHPINFSDSSQVKVEFTTACGGKRTLSLSVNCNEYTSLVSSICSTTINFTDNIKPTFVTGATGYVFDIYNANGSTLISSIENPYNSFSFSQINFSFGATYQVKVRVKKGNTYGIQGSACIVTINSTIPTTTLVSQICGTTVNIKDNLKPIPVAGATGYAFDIYNTDGSTLISTIENSYASFNCIQFNFTFGTTYQVKVRVKRGNSYGNQGSACTITIDSTIPTTTLASQICGTTVNITDNIKPIQVAGATGYAFDIYNADGTTFITTKENLYNSFSFSQLNFKFGNTYLVKVRVKRNNTYGNQGSACYVTLENAPTTAIVSSQCGSILNNVDDKIYATSIIGATMYKFQVYNDNNQTNLLAEIENTKNFFKITDFNYVDGTTYYIKVSIKHVNGIVDYGTAGALCSISTPSEIFPRENVKENIDTYTKIELQVIPNPFTDSFTITSISDFYNPIAYQVFDLTGKLLEAKEVAPQALSVQQIGTNYPTGVYLVKVTQGQQSKTFRMIKQY